MNVKKTRTKIKLMMRKVRNALKNKKLKMMKALRIMTKS